VVIYDPWASPQDVAHEYNLTVTNEKPMQKFDAVVLGVAHNEFKTMHLQDFKKEHSIIYDVKGILGNQADGKL
jgi:UDP-N-acetyl-D-galactosamine dehydrogenase